MSDTTSATPVKLDSVLDALKIKSVPETWRRTWASSQATMPGPVPHCFAEGYLREICEWLQMKSNAAEALQRTSAWMRDDDKRVRLAWHAHQEVFTCIEQSRGKSGQWPDIPAELGEESLLFWAVVLLSGTQAVRDRAKAMGIPDDVVRATLADLELWLHHSHDTTGVWGFGEKGWMGNHFSLRLFKLGRLQYEFNMFNPDFHVFRNRKDRRVITLAGDGMKFREDGQFFNADRREDPKPWTTSYSADGGTIRGYRISPRGMALKETVELKADEWEEVAKQGDDALGVHIDASGPMKTADCVASFEFANRFFREHFPDFKFTAFTCHSWLLDGQFEGRLSDTSNIVGFLSEWHLLPYRAANDDQHFERVFGGPIRDFDSAPQDSSVQRAMIKFCKEGGTWRMGDGFILPGDIPLGRRIYREMAGEK